MLRLSDDVFMKLYPDLSLETKKIIDNRYKCGNGGWIHYRILNDDNLRDIKTLLDNKCK